jgi:hypothetical protein
VSCFFPDAFDSNDFYADLEENPDAGQREIHPVAFVDP